MTSQNYRDPAFLEAFLRERIREKSELDKLDFKLDWKLGTTKEKLELLKDINAIANTYSLDHDDHGFLIFGMNRNDGQITQGIDLLASLGSDKLEAQVTQLVQNYMHPAPKFSLYQFEEEGVGTWGAVVLWPNQMPPFVFTKQGNYKELSGQTSLLWRIGEWRLRRGALTVEPTYADYAQMLRVRIQGATAPLQEEINQLRRQLAVLEGKFEILGRQSSAEIVVEALEENRLAQEVDYVTPTAAGWRALEPYLGEIRKSLEKIKIEHRTKIPIPVGTVSRQGRWMDRQESFSDFAARAIFGSTDSGRYEATRTFLDRWDLHGNDADRDFSQVWLYRYQRTGETELAGPDSSRAQAYTDLLRFADSIRVKIDRAASFAPYKEFAIRVTNNSEVATGRLRLEIVSEQANMLYRFAPKDKSYHHETYAYNARQEVRLDKVEDGTEDLLPGEVWSTSTFALRFTQSGSFNLMVKVWAQRLRQPREFILPLTVTALETRPDSEA